MILCNAQIQYIASEQGDSGHVASIEINSFQDEWEGIRFRIGLKM